MNELIRSLEKVAQSNIIKMIISKPLNKGGEFKKIVIDKTKTGYQISKYTQKQVFHENILCEELTGRCITIIEEKFGQVNAWSETHEHIVMISKKGTCTYKTKKLETGQSVVSKESHNRKKQYILEEGTIVEPLVDMGIFTKEGKIVNSMYDKYRQINRFLEILDDEIASQRIESLNVIDFGCGKSYLTFIIYHYLVYVKNINANIIGLDLKEDVINKCNDAAKKYGYENLKFCMGDINGFTAPFDVDMVVTLHACDTATDFALYNAIKWNAKMIFSVPCCQHELNQQMKPKKLEILSRYGIIKERFAALATDAIRGNLLEYSGYKTQLLEFVDFAHTPKNILIRAVKRKVTPQSVIEKSIKEVENIKEEFGFEPQLCKLLLKDRCVGKE